MGESNNDGRGCDCLECVLNIVSRKEKFSRYLKVFHLGLKFVVCTLLQHTVCSLLICEVTE